MELAHALALRLRPRSLGYRQTWGGAPDPGELARDPLYGSAYLPRKFKIAVGVPPENDLDIYAHDLGFAALSTSPGAAPRAWSALIGGGMGAARNRPEARPLLALPLGTIPAEPDHARALALAAAVLSVQRDWGDRKDRKQARLKYTLRRRGIGLVRAEIERRAGFRIDPPEPIEWGPPSAHLGWSEDSEGSSCSLGLWIPGGRIADAGPVRLRSGVRALACALREGAPGALLVVTAEQNLIVAGVPRGRVAEAEAILDEFGIRERAAPQAAPVARRALACVALPTCGLALAEAERALPEAVREVRAALCSAGLADEKLDLRMTGCPNGCARPYLAELALTGCGPGRYDVFLGGGAAGRRLAHLWREREPLKGLGSVLEPLFLRWARERRPGERFGEWAARAGVADAEEGGGSPPESAAF